MHKKDYVDNGTPIITVEHLGEQGIQHVNLPLVSDKDRERLSGYRLEVGDIVFSRVGSVDRNSIITSKERGWLFSGRLLRIRLCQKNSDPKFLSLSLQQEYTQYRIRAVAVGQTMPSLNTEILKRFSVLLPPRIEEQQKIADFLSSIDTRIEQLEKKKSLFERYKKGLMQKLFSQEIRFKDDQGNEYPEWKKRTLKVFSKIINGVVFAKGEATTNPEKGRIPVLRAGNIGDTLDPHKDLIWLNSNSVKHKQLLQLADIVMCTSSGSKLLVGKNAPLRTNWKGTVGAFCSIIRTNSAICDADYLAYYLGSLEFRKWTQLAYGSNIKNIKTTELENYLVPLPSYKEQKKIASFLSSIDRTIELISEQIIQTREFKKGFLQQMFV